MKIIYYLKGSEKPYLYKGSLANWLKKMEKLDNVSAYYPEPKTKRKPRKKT